MKKKFMSKATFAEVCKVMEGMDKNISECIKGVFGIALLFFPGIICKDVSLLTNVSTGVSLKDAKEAISNSVERISKTFLNHNYEDFSSKYEHAQIAQVLIVFAAYFDSIKMYLPDENREIKLSSEEKYHVAEESIKQYLEHLHKQLGEKSDEKIKEVLEYDLSMPDPIESFSEYLTKLKKFYDILNREFIKFYEKLSFWESMEENERDSFMAVIRQLPSNAVDNYQKQYYVLASKFNDFFVWTNIKEHRLIKNSIDIGFKNISELIQIYREEKSDLKAAKTLEQYKKRYQINIEKPIADTTEMYCESSDNLVFPTKSEIFVPQSFKVLTYRNDMHLEQQEVWDKCDERQDIGKFISDTMRHSKIGELPLLILGHPGAGKSLLCNMIAAKILSCEYHVIIIHLRDTVADETIQQQINQQIERDFSNKCTWSEIVESRLDKPILLIFDGYDELLQASGRTYSDYLKRIAEFQKEQRAMYGIFVKCIITSRITLIDKALISENTPVIKLSDFDETRIKIWSDIWNGKNQNFFLNNQIKPFELDDSSKVIELAKQPLLLLMLALFDSNDNALRKRGDLNSTQLYDSLIRDFILREKKKDDLFRGMPFLTQQKIIDEEMHRISIAALGMYNRKVLYIHSTELELDLDFIEQKKNLQDEMKNEELTESDKLLGSFFFIHRSNSTNLVDRERVFNVAYEFLHNTFGEFLTAHFIVNEVYKMVSSLSVLMNNNMENQLNMAAQKPWYICLAYAPLFSRPVVVKMINEWSSTYLNNKGMTEQIVNKTLEYLENAEIENIINGKTIFGLQNIIEERGNPFKQQAVLQHLAIYSMNLIILRCIIYRNQYAFDFEKYRDADLWNKLVCLWRYSFSEDDLLSYANIFEARKRECCCIVSYVPGEQRSNNQQSKVEKLFCTGTAIGDDITSSVIGALLGKYNYTEILSNMKQNKLNVKARLVWNYVLDGIRYEYLGKDDLFNLLVDLRNFCWKEQDIEYLFCFYLLITHLFKEGVLKNSRKKYSSDIIHFIIQDLNEMEYWSISFYDNSNLVESMRKLISDLLDYLVITDKEIINLLEWCEEKLLRCMRGYFVEERYIISFVNQIFEKAILTKEMKRHMSRRISIRIIEEFLERLLWETREKKIDISTYEVFDFFNNIFKIKNYRISERASDIYIRTIEEIVFDRRSRLSIKQKSKIIDCIYIIQQIGYFDIERIRWILINVMKDTSIKKIYACSEKTALNVCCLLEQDVIDDYCFILDELILLVLRKSERFSLSFYKQMWKLSSKFQDPELERALRMVLEE